ncbi:MAG: hypothetical protein WBG71_09475 [Leeuwenhoekiella sp.]
MQKQNFLKHFLPLLLVLLLQSCYTVRLTSTKGAPMPATLINDEDDDDYRGFMVTEIDTVLSRGAFEEVTQFPASSPFCETGELWSVEFKNTFGGSLLYLVTLGSKRKVKLRYVCMKPEN